MKTTSKVTNKNCVTNEFFVPIRKCCASCKHVRYDSDGNRFCEVLKRLRKPKAICSQWEMRYGLGLAGRWTGKVKSKQYLRFVREERLAEEKAIQDGLLTENLRKKNRQLKYEFTKKYGERVYVIE